METAWLNRRRSQDTWSRQICPTETNVNHGYITNASFRWRHPKRQLTLFLFFFSFYRTTTKSPKFKLDWQCNYWCKTADFQRDTKCDPALLFFFILFSLHCIRATVISDIYEYGGRKWDNNSEFPATWGSLTCAQISDVSFSMSYYAPASIDIEFDTDIHLKFCCDKYSNRCVRF